MKREVVFGLLSAIFLALVISPFASPWPDGLEKVAEDEGFIESGSVVMSSPIPDYVFPWIKNEKIAVCFAGFLGTILVFAATYLLASLLKKKNET